MTFPPLTSAAGMVCEGVIFYLPPKALPEETAHDEQQRLTAACHDMGVDVMGLGGVDTEMNKLVMDKAGIPVTCGTRLTVYACYKHVMQLIKWFKTVPTKETVAIIGLSPVISQSLSKLCWRRDLIWYYKQNQALV
ncbi:hypothetical protein P4S72_00490 [Vibrio sp. PP-XX7]